MTAEELLLKLKSVEDSKQESQTLEVKKAHEGCPRRLYDTLSSFSNQDSGGTILFGLDDENGFQAVGVYDPVDLQRQINAQCLQMVPVVRPVLTAAQRDGMWFVSAEIPGMNVEDRPCHYAGRGILRGSYVRVGESDEPMTDFEVYGYEAYRTRREDEARDVPRADMSALDASILADYLRRMKTGRPNLASIPDETALHLTNLVREGRPTLAAVLLFAPFPQAYFPQLCVTAVSIPGTEIGETTSDGARFLDNTRIEGPIPAMLEESLRFLRRNLRVRSEIDLESGLRRDISEIPPEALREAVANALVHRDYGPHTENMPIQVLVFSNRVEIRNPGGLYGRTTLAGLGEVQPDTRNPVLAGALETLGIVENRYSGIPTIRRTMAGRGLPPPVFAVERGTFVIRLLRGERDAEAQPPTTARGGRDAEALLEFCREPRSRREICDFLGVKSITFAMRMHVRPLVESGRLRLSIPDKPSSALQRFQTVSGNR